MYNPDKYNTYYNTKLNYCFPINFECCRKDYMENKEMPTYTMDYEDTTSIPFTVESRYCGYEIQITIYNFRQEEVYWTSTVAQDNMLYLDINYETSSKILKPGIYYVKMQVIRYINSDENLHPEDTDICVNTIMPADACKIYVR